MFKWFKWFKGFKGFNSVLSVLSVVEKIGLILRRTAIQADTRWYVMNPRALPPVTHGSALQAPERMRILVM